MTWNGGTPRLARNEQNTWRSVCTVPRSTPRGRHRAPDQLPDPPAAPLPGPPLPRLRRVEQPRAGRPIARLARDRRRLGTQPSPADTCRRAIAAALGAARRTRQRCSGEQLVEPVSIGCPSVARAERRRVGGRGTDDRAEAPREDVEV